LKHQIAFLRKCNIIKVSQDESAKTLKAFLGSTMVGPAILFSASTSDPRMILLAAGTLLLIVIAYAALGKERLRWKTVGSLTAFLVLYQVLLKVNYRFFIPDFATRAGDETFWVNQMLLYQTTGSIPLHTLSQGPGLYAIVSSLSPLFSGQYVETLIGIALVFGSLTVVPVLAMQYSLTESRNLALLATAILASFDVIAYSTSIARPTLIAMFLVPLLTYLLVEFRKSAKIVLWLSFLFLSLLLMFTHPIGWVAFLVAAFSVWLLLGFRSRLEMVGAVVLFSSYAIALRFVLLETYKIWRTELLAQTPLAQLSPDLLAIMFVAPAFLLLLVDAAKKTHRFSSGFQFDRIARRRASILVVCAVVLILCAIAYLVFSKYAEYILLAYGQFWLFFALHSWKIPMAGIAVYGLVCVLSRRREEGPLVAVIWLLSMTVLVIFLVAYLPFRSYPGLLNLDERFYEFAMFPAAIFVAYGLDGIFRKVRNPVLRVLIVVLFSLFVVPSLLVGMRDPLVISSATNI